METNKTLIPSVEDIKKFDGQLKKADVDRLHFLGTQVPENGIVVEIGCYKGKSTAAILSGMPKSAKLVALDPWCLLVSNTVYGTMDIIQKFREQIKPWEQQVIQIIGWPIEVAEFWDYTIDLLSVDLVKDYERLSKVWKAWLPYCVNMVASHDYCEDVNHEQYYAGVHKVLNEIVKPVTKDHYWHKDSYTWSGVIKK